LWRGADFEHAERIAQQIVASAAREDCFYLESADSFVLPWPNRLITAGLLIVPPWLEALVGVQAGGSQRASANCCRSYLREGTELLRELYFDDVSPLMVIYGLRAIPKHPAIAQWPGSQLIHFIGRFGNLAEPQPGRGRTSRAKQQ